MKKLFLSFGLSMIVVLTACGQEETEQVEETASTDDGQALYQSASCFTCHGNELEGASGPNLQDVGARLSDEEIRTTIEEGKGAMPAGLVDNEEDLNKLVEWLSEKE